MTTEMVQGAAPSPAPIAAQVAAPTAPEATAPAAAPAAPAATVAGSIDAVAPPAAPDSGAEADVEYSYESTGDAGLDLALDFVGKLGFGPNTAAMKAATAGDFGPLKAALQEKGVKGWERYVALGEKAAQTRAAEAENRVKADQEAINKVVGGQETWDLIANWARTNAEPAEKAAINAALKAGGIAAKAMAAYLNEVYRKSSGTEVQPREVALPGAAPAASQAAGPLTAQQYAKEVQTLRHQLGHAFERSQQYQQLQARRVASARAGH